MQKEKQEEKQNSGGYDAWWFVACYAVEQCDPCLFSLLFRTVPSLMRLKLAHAVDPLCHSAKMYMQLRRRFGFLAPLESIGSVSTWSRAKEKENGVVDVETTAEKQDMCDAVPIKYDSLVAICDKKTAVVFNGKTMRKIVAAEIDGVIVNLDWSPDGKIIALVFHAWYKYAEVAFWNPWANCFVGGKAPCECFIRHQKPPVCQWSPDGSFFAFACAHRITIFERTMLQKDKQNYSFSVRLLRWESVQQLRWIEREQSYALQATCHHFDCDKQAIARLLLWRNYNSSSSSWQNSRETVIDFKKANDKQVVTSLFSANQSRLAYLLRKNVFESHHTTRATISNAPFVDIAPLCSPDETLTLIVNNRRGKIFSLPLKERVDNMIWSPDSRFLALVLSGYNTIEDTDSSNVFLPEITFMQCVQIWEVDSQTLIRTFTDATIVAFSDDSKTVYYNGTIMWNDGEVGKEKKNYNVLHASKIE